MLAIVLAGCTNSANLESIRDQRLPTDTNTVDANAAPDPKTAYETMTLGDFLAKSGEGPPHLCDLENTLKKDGLRLLQRRWASIQVDSRYRMARLAKESPPCTCPGICVIVLQDTEKARPDNYAVLVVDPRKIDDGPQWLAKDVDLANARLAWSSSTPHFDFYDADGNPRMIEPTRPESCWIRWSKSQNRYVCFANAAETKDEIDYFGRRAN
jgi:hypothetical protein